MTSLLRAALTDSGRSLRSIGREAGVDIGSLSRFAAGTNSLRLDKADRLAKVLGIECRRIRRQKGGA